MATYENIDNVESDGQNMFRHYNASTDCSSLAVSNEIYGALLLEPTIPAKKPVFDDLDDFWLQLAKGQTIQRDTNEGNRGHGKDLLPDNNSFVSDTSWQFSPTRPYTSIKRTGCAVNERFSDDTGWEYSPGKDHHPAFFQSDAFILLDAPDNIESKKTDIKKSTDSESLARTDNDFEGNFYDFPKSGKELRGTSSRINDENKFYSLARHIDETPLVVRPKNLPKRSNTMSNAIYEYASPIPVSDDLKSQTLNRVDQRKDGFTPLCNNSVYESVDNLSAREQMPIPKGAFFQRVEIPHSIVSSGLPRKEEPIYAKVVKNKRQKHNTSYSRIDTSNTDDDDFYYLASERVQSEEMLENTVADKDLGLDYTYAKVNKSKRYENWPMSQSIKKSMENTKSQTSVTAGIIQNEVNEDFYNIPKEDLYQYSSIEEIQNERISATPETSQTNTDHNTGVVNNSVVENNSAEGNPSKSDGTKISWKERMKGLFSTRKTKNTSSSNICEREKSTFYPFSFIYNFEINVKGQGPEAVIKILPQIDGKCWVMCSRDLEIRLYDSQGIQTESIYIGLEGQDMTFGPHGHLYISCKNTKRIFKIDTRNLCKISTFVDTLVNPSGLAFDLFDNTLIVCLNPINERPVISSAECLQKYSVGSAPISRNLTTEHIISHPVFVTKNKNGDTIISDKENKSIAILNFEGRLKYKFTGSDDFRIHARHTFVCDIQGNILMFSQDSSNRHRHSDNVCLLDESGDLIDTFVIEEVKDQEVNTMAITDLGFLWIGCEKGIFIFDYEIV